MTQEISDYLLIRYAFLEFDSEDIINTIDSIDTYEPLIKTISSIMQEEDFFLIDETMQRKIQDVFLKYRFKYRNKELTRETNYIIERLNDYKKMSESRKKDLIKRWIKEESQKRCLPLAYSSMENLKELIVFDAECIIKIRTDNGIDLINDEVIKYLSFFNLIRSKSKNDMGEKFYESNRKLIEEVSKEKEFSYTIKSMAKKTLKKMNK